MFLTKDWVQQLVVKYGKRPKELRDILWPGTSNKSLAYFDGTKNIGVELLEKVADFIGCSTDELLRRPTAIGGQYITGDYNQVGNVNINNDVQVLQQIISAQKQIITHQEEEIHRLTDNMKQQLKVKDQQINELIKRIDGKENQ